MGWGNGISIGWPNASAYASPILMERYLVDDCIGQIGTVNTIEYPQGSFIINDRVTFEYNGYSTFGYVLSLSTEAIEDVSIFPTGVNNGVCFDNSLQLVTQPSPNGSQIQLDFLCYPTIADFDGTDSDYSININFYYYIYYVYADGESEGYVGVSGSVSNDDYYFIQNQYNSYGTVNVNLAGGIFVDYCYFNEVYQQPNFGHTNQYTGNNCDDRYFMRENGYTFDTNFRNDDC